jgi:hypothetical protein
MENPYGPPQADLDSGLRGNVDLVRVFRGLAAVSLLCNLIVPGLQLLPLPLASDTEEILNLGGHGSLLGDLQDFFHWSFFVLWGVTACGLLFLRKWARTLLVVTYLTHTPYLLVTGLNVMLSIEFVAYTMGVLAEGAILALAFTDPVRRQLK